MTFYKDTLIILHSEITNLSQKSPSLKKFSKLVHPGYRYIKSIKKITT